jgi:hypothetical protein
MRKLDRIYIGVLVLLCAVIVARVAAHADPNWSSTGAVIAVPITPVAANPGTSPAATFTVQGQVGGPALSGNNTGGTTATMTWNGGAGGTSTGSAPNANGEAIAISGGVAGTGGGGTAGKIGLVELQTGGGAVTVATATQDGTAKLTVAGAVTQTTGVTTLRGGQVDNDSGGLTVGGVPASGGNAVVIQDFTAVATDNIFTFSSVSVYSAVSYYVTFDPPVQLLSFFPACAAKYEGGHGIQTDSSIPCVAGVTATGSGSAATHCEVVCSKSSGAFLWQRTGL